MKAHSIRVFLFTYKIFVLKKIYSRLFAYRQNSLLFNSRKAIAATVEEIVVFYNPKNLNCIIFALCFFLQISTHLSMTLTFQNGINR